MKHDLKCIFLQHTNKFKKINKPTNGSNSQRMMKQTQDTHKHGQEVNRTKKKKFRMNTLPNHKTKQKLLEQVKELVINKVSIP